MRRALDQAALQDGGLSLAQAGLLTAAPTAGLLATLIAWGAAADRWGERLVLTTGLTLAGVFLLAATRLDGATPTTGASPEAGVAGVAPLALFATTPPAMAALIGATSYGAAFAAAIAFPLLAAVAIPKDTAAAEDIAAPEDAAAPGSAASGGGLSR
ncbi:hypothetical protein ACQPZJ_32760 [Actinoplanes sp. CA-054009]